MNVMITSAGRRVTLLQKFVEACGRRGGTVTAGDLSSLAPALYLASGGQIQLPPVRDAGYMNTLLDVAKKHKLSAIVPTLDPELPVMSPYREEFAKAGCALLVSETGFNVITGDKWLTTTRFAARGIDTPRSWLPGQLGLDSLVVAGAMPLQMWEREVEPGTAEQEERLAALPETLYIKPRDGSASQNVYRIGRDQLSEYAKRVPNAIIQEELEGEEITIDAFLSPEGQPLHYVPRKRLRTLAGESITGVTIGNDDVPGIEQWCEEVVRVCGELGARWAITLQGFATERGMVLTEINARFGGGAPLAFAAGGDYPELAVRLLAGETVAPALGQYKRGLYFMRYMTEVFTDKPAW